MTPARTEGPSGFHAVLAASGRSPTIPDSMDVYGWLVGSWELEVVRYWGVAVAGRGLRGEVHVGWVLEGRAIQDVWIMPRRSDRTGSEAAQNMYGTTLRVVQVGVRPNGTPTRWTFTEITTDSFRWLGDALEPDGKTWTREGEFRARRVR